MRRLCRSPAAGSDTDTILRGGGGDEPCFLLRRRPLSRDGRVRGFGGSAPALIHSTRGPREPTSPRTQSPGLRSHFQFVSWRERERDGQGASDPRLWNILPAGPSNGAAGLAVYVEPIRRKLTLSVLWPAVRPSPSAYIEDSAFSASSLLPGRAFSVCVWVGKCRRTVASSLHLTR